MTENPSLLSVPVDDVSGESEDDVIGKLGAHRVNVSATDWTIETIVNQMIKGRIDLNPSFQRRAAWTPALKSRFIESAILAYPIPQIVLAEKSNRPGHYIVIDGKQRLLALRQFYAGSKEYNGGGFSPFTLQGLTILTDIKGYNMGDLIANRQDLYDPFENHTIRTVVVRNWVSDDFLYTLFLRLNTGSVPLSPQELRQALEPGPFVNYVDDASGASPGLRRLLGNTEPDRRMVDAELMVRLLGLNASRTPYKGNLKDFLDRVCRNFNKSWTNSKSRVKRVVENMEASIDTLDQIFEGRACRKWTNDHYERAFNRALFDVQVAAFLNSPRIRASALKHAGELVDLYKILCDNEEFARSITSTTKTPSAFNTRFTLWNTIIEDVTGQTPKWPSALERL